MSLVFIVGCWHRAPKTFVISWVIGLLIVSLFWYLVFGPGCWYRERKEKAYAVMFKCFPFKIQHECKPLDSWVIRMSFVQMWQLLMGSWIVTHHQKDEAVIRSLKLTVPFFYAQEGERTINLINNCLCLCVAAFIKIPEPWGSENSQDGEHWDLMGWWCTLRGHGCSVPLPPTLTYVSLLSYCSFESFYIKQINKSKVISWVLWVILVCNQPKEGVVGPSFWFTV